MRRFENINVLLSGGNSGIGLEAVKKFISEGAKVFVLDIESETSPELLSLKESVHYQKCDVSKKSEVLTAFEKAISIFKRIHIVINNAGILGPRIKSEDYSEEDFDRVIQVNVNGVFYCMKAGISHFKEKGGGVIVNTASVAGKLGMSRHLAYSASKHAVIGMTKTAALECAKSKIRINSVCPGFTETAMLDTANAEPEYKEQLRFATPMRRFGKPEEIADAILYLASDQASFITGQSIVLDGGLSVQ